MLTGEIPNSHLQECAVVFAVGSTKTIEYELPDITSDKMRAFIALLLGKDTQDRPNAEEALAHEIFL